MLKSLQLLVGLLLFTIQRRLTNDSPIPLFFVSPKSVVTITSKVGGKAIDYLPIAGPTLKYIKKAKKVTNLSDPVSATSRGIGVMFDYCFGPVGAKSVECVLWLGLSVAGGLTCNPILIAAGAEFGDIILEDVLS